MQKLIFAAVLILATIVSFSATAKEFQGPLIIEVRECNLPIFVMVVTPEGEVHASPVYRNESGVNYLDGKEIAEAILLTIGSAAALGQVGVFHADRHKGRTDCVEARNPGRPAA